MYVSCSDAYMRLGCVANVHGPVEEESRRRCSTRWPARGRLFAKRLPRTTIANRPVIPSEQPGHVAAGSPHPVTPHEEVAG
jgi:hypothetical protein